MWFGKPDETGRLIPFKPCLQFYSLPGGSFQARSWNPAKCCLSFWTWVYGNVLLHWPFWLSYWFLFCKGGTIALPYLFIFLQSLNASKLHFLPLSMYRAIKHRCGWRVGGRIVTLRAYGAIRQQAAFNEIWLVSLFVHHIWVLLNKFSNLSVTVSEHEGTVLWTSCSALFFTSNLQYPRCRNGEVFISD